jgi:hypothetical protein
MDDKPKSVLKIEFHNGIELNKWLTRLLEADKTEVDFKIDRARSKLTERVVFINSGD